MWAPHDLWWHAASLSMLIRVRPPQGTTSAAYLAAFDEHVAPNLRRFAPDLIIISTGFDACAGDSPAHPAGYLQLVLPTDSNPCCL